MRLLVGPRGIWLVGNVADTIRYGRHGVMARWSKYHEGTKLGKIFFGARSFLVTDDPTAARCGISAWTVALQSHSLALKEECHNSTLSSILHR